ncbi:CD276 antigen homolog [Centroberyx affinis]|uniref:CD276 antigen homolog n=1 Tax=Centroberyx affinis TaxID=166261 RepID=UPI003A5C702F
MTRQGQPSMHEIRKTTQMAWDVVVKPSNRKEQDKTIHLEKKPEVIGSLQPITVVIGGDAFLPCHLEPPSDVTELVVEWKLNKSFVHVYRHREDSPDLQDKRFENRTSLFREEMTKGNISLKLSSVQRSDEGRYTCFVPQLRGKRGFVDLIVALKVTEGNKMQERGESKEPDGEKMYAGKIAGIVVAVVVLLVGGVVWAVKRRQSKQQAARSGVAVDLHEMDKLTSQTTETPAA